MAEEIDFENGRNWNFEGLVTLTLTFDPAYCPAAVIDLYLYTKFHSNWRNFLWTDGRTDGRTFFPSILLGRLSEVDLIMALPDHEVPTVFRKYRDNNLESMLTCLYVLAY